MLLNVYLVIVIITFLASLTVYFQKGSKPFLRLFSLLLIVTILVEVVAIWLHSHKKSTSILYNCFSVFEFQFYMYVLRTIIQSSRVKRIILYIAWVYLALGMANILFIQKITHFNSITYALGCLIIAVVCFYYFFELFQQSSSVNLTRQPAFWICAGLLFYYTCSFPIYGLVNFFSQDFITKNLQILLFLLNVLLYSSFTIAFLCRLRVRNSTS